MVLGELEEPNPVNGSQARLEEMRIELRLGKKVGVNQVNKAEGRRRRSAPERGNSVRKWKLRERI